MIINLIYCFSKNKTGKIAAFILKAKTGAFGAEGFFKILTMFEMDLFLGAYANSKYYAGDEYKTIQNIGNHLFAQTLIYTYPVVIFYYFIRTREIYLYSEGRIDMDEDVAARYEFLIEERKDVTWYHKYCEVLSMLRNYTTCATVVTFYEYPSVQLIITTILILVTFIIEVMHRPRKSKLETTVIIVIWAAYLGLALCFNFIHFLGGNKSKELIYIYIGYPMILFFCVLVAINFIPIIINIASSLYKAIVKCKNRKKFKKVNSNQSDGIPAQSYDAFQRNGSSRLACTPILNKVSPSNSVGVRDKSEFRLLRKRLMASDSVRKTIDALK